MTLRDNAIEVRGVSKSFGKIHALVGVDLTVKTGTVMGLLGPNGAGKTTLVRILTTLLKPTSGSAFVLGFDVVRQARLLRSRIGLAGQAAAVDDLLTGRENIELAGRLYHLPRGLIKERTETLLEQFDLVEPGDRAAREYSGGMRRRLDLAASLIADPPMIFLDEPTTGLDPRGRAGMWDVIKGLVKSGTTVLLTTQYLEEADNLADQITVIDHGRVIAEGTADELKQQTGSEFIEVTVRDADDVDKAADVLRQFTNGEVPDIDAEARTTTFAVSDGSSLLPSVVRAFDAENVPISNMMVREPTLDDVFIALTGRTAEEAASERGEEQ